MIGQMLKCCWVSNNRSYKSFLWTSMLNLFPIIFLIGILAGNKNYQLSHWIYFGTLLFVFYLLCPHSSLLQIKAKMLYSNSFHLFLYPKTAFVHSLYYWIGQNIEQIGISILIYGVILVSKKIMSEIGMNFILGFGMLIMGVFLRFTICYVIMIFAKSVRDLNVYYYAETITAGLFGALLPLAIAPSLIREIAIIVPSAYVFGYGSLFAVFDGAHKNIIAMAVVQIVWLVLFVGIALIKTNLLNYKEMVKR